MHVILVTRHSDRLALGICTNRHLWVAQALLTRLLLACLVAAEKAAKQARKERLLAKQATGAGLFGNGNLLAAAQLQQQLLGLVSQAGRCAGRNEVCARGHGQQLQASTRATAPAVLA